MKMPNFITFEEFKSKVEDLIVWKVSIVDIAFHIYLHHPIDSHYNLGQHNTAIQSFVNAVMEATSWLHWRDIYVNNTPYQRLKMYIQIFLELHEECYEKSLQPGGYLYNKAKENFETLSK